MRPSPSKLLDYAGVPALLVTDLVNIRYLTGISLSSGTVLVTPKAFRLYVDARYAEMAAKSAKKPVQIADRAELAKDVSHMRVCGFEEKNVTMAHFRSWKTKYKNTKFVRTDDAVEHFRRAKGADEMKLMRKAKQITETLLACVPQLLEKGVAEKEVAWALEAQARFLGAEGFAFEPIVAFGSNSSRPHHRASDRKLKKGDLVQLDIGVLYKGYAADMSRVYLTGKPTRQQVDALLAVEEAKNAAMKAAKEGMTGKELDEVARKVLRKHAMEKYFTHALGHGVGLEVHEGITIAARDTRPLLKGEVIAIEPGVYFPGKFGVRLEDMVFVR